MIVTAFAQLRFAASLLSGRRFSVRGLRRTVADLLATIEEFGEPTEEARDLLTARAETDPDVIRHIAESRLKKAVRTAAARTPFYADLFARHGIDPGAVTLASFSSLPRTPKSALRDAPFAFVSDRAEPVLMAQTTGTTGTPTCVWFSRYELEAITSFSALSLMLFDGIRPRHVIATLFSNRSTYTLVSMQQTGLLIGAGVVAIGMVDPRDALERLATPLQIPGKAPRITHVSVTSSYLAALVQQAERDGWGPRDFGLEQIFAAGEILTDSLRHRAEEIFGAPVSETYSATEITPIGGQVCSRGHLHIPPEQGYVEILDPETGRPAEPGQVGTLVVTPYGLYRDTTLLIRYETGDLVRTLPAGEPVECELRAIPATSRILGRAGTAAAHRARDILDVLEGERAVPLPARYALIESACGACLYVVVSDLSPEVTGRLESRLFERAVGIDEVIAVADKASLPVPCPVRADLREPSSAAALHGAADREPARSGA